MKTENQSSKPETELKQETGEGCPEATFSPREEFKQAIGLAGLPDAVHPLFDCNSDYIEWLEKKLLEARSDAEWARDLIDGWSEASGAKFSWENVKGES